MLRGKWSLRERGGNGKDGYGTRKGKCATNVRDDIDVDNMEQSTNTIAPLQDLPLSFEPWPSDPLAFEPHLNEALAVGAHLPTLHPNGKT